MAIEPDDIKPIVTELKAQVGALEALVTPVPPVVAPQPDMTATVTYNGTNYVFKRSSGADLGDYVDPQGRFTQGCILAPRMMAMPFRVYFRSDKQPGADRDEVVFELGDIFDVPVNMTAYQVVIAKGTTMLAVIDVRTHGWHKRWRWQSAQRPVTGDITHLKASGLLPNYNPGIAGYFTPIFPARTYVNPMDLAGITPHMPDTGERADIGPITEQQAEYVCFGTSTSLASTRAQLEAAGSLPWHFRDDKNPAPLDVNTHLQLTLYNPNAPRLPPSNIQLISRYPVDPVTLDTAHEPSLAYLMFLLTGDTYALEEQQFNVTYDIVSLPATARKTWNWQQTRAFAWTLRNLAQAAKITPAAVPSWLKPQAYFQALLNEERDWLLGQAYVASTKPLQIVFQVILSNWNQNPETPIPGGTYIAPWEQDFAAFVIGWVVRMGFADWAPIHNFIMKQLIARSNGTSGWVRAIPTAYRMQLRPSATTPVVASWAEAWALGVTVSKYAPPDPNTLTVGGDLTYPSYLLGALAMACDVGVTEARPCYDWLRSQIAARTNVSKFIQYKWSIAA